MSVSKREVFRRHEPPPGGRVLLQRRLEDERGRPFRRRAMFAGAAMATAIAATMLTLWVGRPPAAASTSAEIGEASIRNLGASHPALVSLGIDNAPAEPVVVRAGASHQYAVRRMPVDRPDVVFYLVASSAASE